MSATAERLDIWTIYERPRDYPHGYVVRVWDAMTNRPNLVAQYAPTLEAARALVPPGLVMFSRAPDDDPCIKETWL